MVRRATRVAIVIAALCLSACGGGSAQPPPTAQPPVATQIAAAEAPGALAPAPLDTIAAGRMPLIAIDAGHGGTHNIGAVHHDAQGRTDLVEKDLNLDIARRIEPLLRAAGYRTAMIRDSDMSLTSMDQGDFTQQVRTESQARVDKVNALGADIMIIIHFDGSDDPRQGGTWVYYNPDRTFGDKSRQLAAAIHDALIATLRALPYDVNDRGVQDDAPIGERFGVPHTFTLGDSPGFRPMTVPAVIGEALFVTNDVEARLLQEDRVREAIAQAYVTGVEAYFASVGR